MKYWVYIKSSKNSNSKGMLNGSTKIQGHVEQGCNKPLIHEKVKMGGVSRL
jgi:hypothetical protein